MTFKFLIFCVDPLKQKKKKIIYNFLWTNFMNALSNCIVEHGNSSECSTLWNLDIKNQELLYVKKVLWSIILIDW